MNLSQEQLIKIIELGGQEVDFSNITETDLTKALISIERKLNFFLTPIDMSIEKKFNILIVDDLELSIYQLNQMLKRIGIVASVARNKEEAMAEINKKKFNYITIDLYLPALEDGLELIKKCVQMREKQATDFKILAISSTDDEKLIEKCYSMGIDQFISKQEKWHEHVLKYISETVEKMENDVFSKYTINNNIMLYSLTKINSPKRIEALIKDVNACALTGCPNVVFNMEKIKVFNQEYANLFTEVYKICSEAKGQFILMNTSDELEKILNEAFLADIIPVLPSVEKVISYISEKE